MPTRTPAKNREYVYRARAKALDAGKCKTCFRLREPERATKTQCVTCAKVQSIGLESG